MSDQKNNPSKNVRILRLKTGEQIITRIKNSNNDKLFLDRPMKISTMLMRDADDPESPLGREYVYMNNWVEFSLDNHIAIPKSIVYAILPPNEETLKAYKMHKNMEDKSQLPKTIEENDEEYMTFSDIVSDIVGDIISSHMGIDGMNEEETWDENLIDKNRKDYGNHLDDWSPYVDDYFDNI